MKKSFSQIEPLPLSDRIARQIEDAIMSGRIGLGDRINTDELARQFKVSHIPIREALKRLEAVGLIVPEANKSARVLDLSKEDVRHIFEVRKTLEGLAVALAATRIDAGGKKDLQAMVQKMRQTAKSKDFVNMFAADKKFHQTIWNLSGNPFLVKMLNQLLMPYFGFLATRGYYAHLDNLSYVPRVHQEILDALLSADVERAQRVLVDVHTRSLQLMMSQASEQTSSG
ncbi:MAG TPA: GntR family transcriptional regulator [Blastocatellia bacterium]|nr:GntR family transcriptional regulator [Blastocatellia bacterium]